jgi:tetratricopeptide (TPR) repeat protein
MNIDWMEFEPLYLRGNAKYKLKDYRGAIEDFTKVIEMNPSADYAYRGRGLSKCQLGDFNGGMLDIAITYAKGGDINRAR